MWARQFTNLAKGFQDCQARVAAIGNLAKPIFKIAKLVSRPLATLPPTGRFV
jgi:hypothetical protein